MTKIIKNVAFVTSLILMAGFAISVNAGPGTTLSFDCSDNGTTVSCAGSMLGARNSTDATRSAVFAKMPVTIGGVPQDALLFQSVINGRIRMCLLDPANLQNDLEAALALAPNNYFVVRMPTTSNTFSGICTSFQASNNSIYLP